MDIAGAEIIASASSSMAMLGGSDIDVEITGDDYATLAMIAGDLKRRSLRWRMRKTWIHRFPNRCRR